MLPLFGFNTMGPLPFQGWGIVFRCNNFTLLSQKCIPSSSYLFYVLGISAPTPGGLSRRIIWGLPNRRGIRMSSPTLKVANRNRNWNRMTLLRTNLVHQVQAGSLGALQCRQPTDEKGWKADVCSDLDYIFCKESNDFKQTPILHFVDRRTLILLHE